LAYDTQYSPDSEEHLRSLTARQRGIVFDGVDKQLIDRPSVETRNRKRMRPNLVAPWELRLGNLRVYYDIVEEPSQIVTILAVGVKKRNRVWIGGKEFEL
jgi:mRNA-degrading endonuclease RelE of RelBE toxin-antitoxin system